MGLTLEQVNEKAAVLTRSQAYKDMGLEYNARVLCPPADDTELQAIIAREKEMRRDDRIPADIRCQQRHCEAIEKKIDKLVYATFIDEDIVKEVGLLTILFYHHLEKIELGDKNPLAKDLLDIFKSCK